jgi:hypothetical protein
MLRIAYKFGKCSVGMGAREGLLSGLLHAFEKYIDLSCNRATFFNLESGKSSEGR